MEIFLKEFQFAMHACLTNAELKLHIEKELNLSPEQYYLISNGKRIDSHIKDGRIYIIPRVLGGKGGFGSMLRAIGAQIEKTTNREACRDLSGRRLRDINEEQRLKNWINQQTEREKETKERRKKKLEKLCEKPRHEFKDEEYDKERSELPEKVEDALLQGLQASCSSKRKTTDTQVVVKKKKSKLWVDDELDSDLSCSASEDESGLEEANNSNNSNDIARNSESGDSKVSNDTNNINNEDSTSIPIAQRKNESIDNKTDDQICDKNEDKNNENK